MKDSR